MKSRDAISELERALELKPSRYQAYATMALVLLALVNRSYRVPYPWRRTLALAGLAAGLLVAWSYVPAIATWPVELAMCAAYCVAALAIVRR